jgi:hypothetical protein
MCKIAQIKVRIEELKKMMERNLETGDVSDYRYLKGVLNGMEDAVYILEHKDV